MSVVGATDARVALRSTTVSARAGRENNPFPAMSLAAHPAALARLLLRLNPDANVTVVYGSVATAAACARHGVRCVDFRELHNAMSRGAPAGSAGKLEGAVADKALPPP